MLPLLKVLSSVPADVYLVAAVPFLMSDIAVSRERLRMSYLVTSQFLAMTPPRPLDRPIDASSCLMFGVVTL